MHLFTDFIHSFYYCVLILCAVCSFFLFKKAHTAFRYVGLLIILTLLSELVAKYLSYTLQISNNIVYHFFTPVEYLFYTLIFSTLFKGRKSKIAIYSSLVLLIIAEVVNTIYFQDLTRTNTNTMIVESLFLVFFSLLYFAKLMESVEFDKIQTEGVFLFNSAVLLYYAFNILVWGFHNIKVYNLMNPPTIIYQINLFFCGLMYLAFTISIYIDTIKNTNPA